MVKAITVALFVAWLSLFSITTSLFGDDSGGDERGPRLPVEHVQVR